MRAGASRTAPDPPNNSSSLTRARPGCATPTSYAGASAAVFAPSPTGGQFSTPIGGQNWKPIDRPCDRSSPQPASPPPASRRSGPQRGKWSVKFVPWPVQSVARLPSLQLLRNRRASSVPDEATTRSRPKKVQVATCRDNDIQSAKLRGCVSGSANRRRDGAICSSSSERILTKLKRATVPVTTPEAHLAPDPETIEEELAAYGLQFR